MKTLDEAWQWYVDVKNTLKCMNRAGVRWWDHITWDQPPWQGDDYFSELTQTAVTSAAQNGLHHLDDLAVVVLFSVFEANVRKVIIEQVATEERHYQHRAILEAITTAKNRIEEGSFFAVLNPFKDADPNLIEEVHQVRRYRNWVCHGKRGAQPPIVSPLVALDRLMRCMTLLFPSIPDEWVRVAAYYGWEKSIAPHGNDAAHWNKAKIYLQEMVRTGQLRL